MKKALCSLFFMTLIPLAVPALNLWGIEITGIEIHSGLLSISNTVVDSAPAPLVNPVGLSIPFRYGEYFVFRPEVSVFWNPYEWNGQRAIPTEANLFDAVMMMGLVIHPQAGIIYSLFPRLAVSGEAGLAFVNRFPIGFLGDGGDQALDITAWFVAGRFLYPSLSGSLLWQISELFTLSLRYTFLYPIFQLWNPEPWNDQVISGFELGLRFNF